MLVRHRIQFNFKSVLLPSNIDFIFEENKKIKSIYSKVYIADTLKNILIQMDKNKVEIQSVSEMNDEQFCQYIGEFKALYTKYEGEIS